MRVCTWITLTLMTFTAVNPRTANDRVDFEKICNTLLHPLDEINRNIAQSIKDSFSLSDEASAFFESWNGATNKRSKGVDTDFDFLGARKDCVSFLNQSQQNLARDDWGQFISGDEKKLVTTPHPGKMTKEKGGAAMKNEMFGSYCDHAVLNDDSLVPCLCLNWTIALEVQNNTTEKNRTREIKVPLDADFEGHCNENNSSITFRWLQRNGNETANKNLKNELSLHLIRNGSLFNIDEITLSLNSEVQGLRDRKVMNTSLKLLPASIHNEARLCDKETKILIDTVTVIIRNMKLFASNDSASNGLDQYCVVFEKGKSRSIKKALNLGIISICAVLILIGVFLIAIRYKKTVVWKVPVAK